MKQHQGCAHYHYDVNWDKQFQQYTANCSTPQQAVPYSNTATRTLAQWAQVKHVPVRYKRVPRFPNTVPTMFSSLELAACHHNRATSVRIRLIEIPWGRTSRRDFTSIYPNSFCLWILRTCCTTIRDAMIAIPHCAVKPQRRSSINRSGKKAKPQARKKKAVTSLLHYHVSIRSLTC